MTSTTEATFATEWQQWHADRERYYRDPLGWVSIVDIHWLSEEFEAFDGVPGRWRADSDAVYVEGLPDEGAQRLEPVEGAPGLLVDAGVRRIEVIRRTGSVALRIHDPASPHLAIFRGIPAYEPDERWRVTATFTQYEQPRTVTTGAVVEGLGHHHNAVGVLHFELDGTARQLVAFTGKSGGLQVLFTDATSGVTTYPAARSLAVDSAGPDGTVTLDFNRAANLPCSFTDFATCPVAPAENRLPIAVAAGEKTPR